MWRNRTKLLSGVLVFLFGCAVLGFIMGVKGALPRGGASSVDTGPPAAPSDAVVIEAAPLEEAITTPPAESETDEEAEAEKEEAKEPEKKAEPTEQPKAAPAPPPPAPKEEPPPADPVGDLIEGPPPDAVLY